MIADMATGCYSVHGLGFWILIPFPSIFLGISMGRFMNQLELKKPVLLSIALLLILSTAPVLIEFFRFPQLYFFNHIWGYWPGPIYDETVMINGRLFLFRTSTLVWGFVFWFIPFVKEDFLSRVILVLSLFFLVFFYANLSRFGMVAPEDRIQSNLGALYQTEHFNIFYPSGTLSEDSLMSIADLTEKYLDEITLRLEVDKKIYRKEPIHYYLYRNEDQKKKLTGAGQTSFVPVWLSQDQMHITLGHLKSVLKHEMVHVVAKQFGNRFGASISIGLIEGLAVALDPERYDDEVSIDQVVAAKKPLPGREELQEMFSFTGFYRFPAIVSYTVTGSFVNYLAKHVSVEQLKEAYRTGDLNRFLDKNSSKIVESWHQYLHSIPVDSAALAISERVYTTKSLFEKRCPRVEV